MASILSNKICLGCMKELAFSLAIEKRVIRDADTYDNNYYNKVKCTSWRLDLPTTQLFIKRFILAKLKENMKALVMGICHSLIPHTKVQ